MTIGCRVDPKRQETSEQFNKGLFKMSKNSKRAASGSSTGSGGGGLADRVAWKLNLLAVVWR